MKKFITVLMIAAVLFIGYGIITTRLRASQFPDQRQFEVTYAASLEGIPAEARQVRIWIPLAKDRDGQKILAREVSAPGPYQITQDTAYGNEMIYFEVKPPFPEKLEFKIDYHAQVAKSEFVRSNLSGDTQLYLTSSRLMTITNEVIQKSQEATRKKMTLREKARGIYDYVIQHMKYDKTTPGWGRGDTLRACLLGKGNCTDFHSLFISMAHASEIPARFKIGFTIPKENEGEIPGYHCWAEFYEEGKGWQPVDASDAWKHPERKEVYFGNFDTNKFLVSVGRDIELSPRQAGNPVNIFFYPHVEVDGKEWNGVKTSFQFKNLKP
jgi:transglutaminase-like putative cysteine protease